MGKTTSIRPLTADDKPAVMHILRNTPEFLPHEVTVAEELIDYYLEGSTQSSYYIQVAETDGEITGYVCYGPTPLTEGTWDLYWIAVSNERQGLGIGRILMQYTEDDIKRLGGRMVMVETSGKSGYNKTRRFYEALQYKNVARVPDFYAPDDDLVVFTKKLR